jgi:hypothetical protein
MTEPVPGPSSPGSVVLELGPGVGALVLHTPQELDGREIEVSLQGAPTGHRTHSQVRQRQLPGGPQYAAVYPGLPAGTYTIWHDTDREAGSVTIAGGEVVTAWWPPD